MTLNDWLLWFFDAEAWASLVTSPKVFRPKARGKVWMVPAVTEVSFLVALTWTGKD